MSEAENEFDPSPASLQVKGRTSCSKAKSRQVPPLNADPPTARARPNADPPPAPKLCRSAWLPCASDRTPTSLDHRVSQNSPRRNASRQQSVAEGCFPATSPFLRYRVYRRRTEFPGHGTT